MKTLPITQSEARSAKEKRLTCIVRPVRNQPPDGANDFIVAADGSGDIKFVSMPIHGVSVARTPWLKLPLTVGQQVGLRVSVRHTNILSEESYMRWLTPFFPTVTAIRVCRLSDLTEEEAEGTGVRCLLGMSMEATFFLGFEYEFRKRYARKYPGDPWIWIANLEETR